MKLLQKTFIVLRFVARYSFDTNHVASMSPSVQEDETDPRRQPGDPAELTPEQNELRLHGLRILARIIARRLLADRGSFEDRSGTSRASPTKRDSMIGRRESIE